MVRYDKIVEFTESLSPPVNIAGVPESLSRSIERKQPKTSTVDQLSQKIYQLEKDQRKQQLLQVLENVGDIPRSMLGYDIKETTSIDRLGEQIAQLPRLTTLQEDNQEDRNVLNEYNYLRDQLIKKCNAIRVGNGVLNKSDKDIDTIKYLLRNIPNSQEFFSSYSGILKDELKRF